MKQNRINDLKAINLSSYIILICGSFLMLMPLVWLVRSSFMMEHQIFEFPPVWIPEPITFQNYPAVFEAVPFLRYFFNTFIILIPSVVGVVISCCMAAYAFSRLNWPFRDLIFAVLMTTLMLPYAVTLIPTFLIWAKLGLVNTYWPLIIPKWFGAIFYIFLLRQFFLTIPKELDDAAKLDGANPLQILWYILLPLSRPALITVAIFAALAEWNDFLGPLIYLNQDEYFAT